MSLGQEAEDRHEERGTQHADDAHAVALALEEVVGGPAGEERAQDAGDLEGRNGPTGVLDRQPAVLGQELGAPVENAHAHDVDEEVGDAEGPHPAVAPDHHRLETAARLLAHLFRVGAQPRVGQIRKFYILGLIAQPGEDHDGAGHGQAGRDPEAPFPGSDVSGILECLLRGVGHAVVGQVGRDASDDCGVGAEVRSERAHQVAADDDGQGGADRVGAVPYRHLGGQLRGVDPVGEDPCAGRVAHALEILVEDDDHAHDPHEGLDQFRAVLDARDPGAEVGAEAEGEVGGGAQQQAQGHDDASPDAVYHIAVDEAREAVDERPGEDDPSEIRVRDPVFSRESRHGQ